MVIKDFDEYLNDGKPIEGYYVYGWFNRDWGVYFYIGRGRGDRYRQKHNRSKAFRSIVTRWKCEPIILATGLTLEEAEFIERDRKQYLSFVLGHPILDGEPSGMRALAQREGIESAKERGVRFGRQPKNPDNFAEVYRRQQNGELSLNEAMALVGVGRTKWYELAKGCVV